MRVPLSPREMLEIDVGDQLWAKMILKRATGISAADTCLDPFPYIYLCTEYRDKLVDMMKAKRVCCVL